jgi:hypothetical protein
VSSNIEADRLLAVAEAIKAEAGVVQHHVLPYRDPLDPDKFDGRYGWSFPKRGIIHARRGAPIRSSTPSPTNARM